MKRNLLLLLLAGMVLLAVAPGAVADPLSVTKLVGRYKLPQINPGLGLSIAVNDRYIVCGERGNDDRGLNAGAAQVYDARTGRYLRTLFGTDTAAGDTFGESVAVFGNMALVGATGANGAGGKAYLFDLRRGKQTMVLEPSDLGPGLNFGRTVALGKDTAFVGTPIRGGKGAVYRFDLATLAETIVEASDGVADDDFGGALDLEGRWLLVGAPQESTSTGKAYLIDTESLDELAIFTPGDGAAMDFFGNSVALDGDFALLGAPGHDSAGAEAGAAYLYQISNGMQLHKFDGNAAGDFFGQAVAMDENRIAIGAGEADFLGLNTVGEVELFDRRTTASLGVLHSHDRQTSHRFGTYLALCGNRLVVGVPGDTRNASLLGAIYLHSPVVGPLPLARVAALRDFAPGADSGVFGRFVEASLETGGGVAFTATLSGAPKGQSAGMWQRDTAAGPLRKKFLQGFDVDLGQTLKSVVRPIFNDDGGSIVEATLTGAGVTAANNRELLTTFGGGGIQLRVGNNAPAVDPTPIKSFGSAVQATQGMGAVVTAIPVRLDAKIGPADASNDSLLLRGVNFALDLIARENAVSPVPGAPFGELARVKFESDRVAFAAPLQSDPSDNHGLFTITPGGGAKNIILRRGDAPVGGGGALLSTVIGETIASGDRVVFRASLSGPGVKSSNREALLSKHTGSVKIVARKGEEVPAGAGLPAGVKWSRFLQFWSVDDRGGSPCCVFLAKISGPGVSGKNDCALFLQEDDEEIRVLLREGDPAPGCGSACVGSFQRVAVCTGYGRYAVLVSLTGATSLSNQALLRGTIFSGAGFPVGLWRPHLVLRKGTRHASGIGEIASVKSMAFPTAGVDASGAGGGGLAQPVVISGRVLIQATFSNRAVELLRYDPPF